jgi:predicted HTH domain antitoxin
LRNDYIPRKEEWHMSEESAKEGTGSISLEEVAKLSGVPLAFLKEELLFDSEYAHCTIDELRDKALRYLSEQCESLE